MAPAESQPLIRLCEGGGSITSSYQYAHVRTVVTTLVVSRMMWGGQVVGCSLVWRRRMIPVNMVTNGSYSRSDFELKDTNNPIGPLNWKFAAGSDIIRCALLAPLSRFMSHLRPRCVAPTDRVGAGRRDHGAPTSGAYSRTAAARTSSLSASRSSDPRCTQPVAPPNPVAILSGHPRDSVAVASASGQAQVAEMAKTTRPWSPADEERTGRAHRSARSGERALGMHPHPG